jgi:peptidoglycan/xylan/chitin deacetylase (PgdA/CDA1 family)
MNQSVVTPTAPGPPALGTVESPLPRSLNGEYPEALDVALGRGLSRFSWLTRLPRFPMSRQSGPIILMYHQVAVVENDVWSLAVSPRHFEEHLEVLARRREAVSLPQLTAERGATYSNRRQVAITFDDGYADNLTNAKPILERFAMPATVFVVGDAIGGGREFWWDALDQIFLGRHELPKSLRLRIEGRDYQWDLRPTSGGLSGWRGTPSERLRRILWSRLRELHPQERWRLIAELQAWAGQSVAVRSDRRVMTAEEVRLLGADGLIEIGSHTATHPRLAALSAAAQLDDIRRGKHRLEEIIEAPITSFSYPFGGQFDVSATTVNAVRQAGFARACTTRRGTVRPSTNPLRLPRLYVGDWSGEEFERNLAPWL